MLAVHQVDKGDISEIHDFNRDEKGKDITDFAVLKDFHDKVEARIEDHQKERKEKKLWDMPASVGVQLMGWKDKRSIEKVIEYFNMDFEYAKRPEFCFGPARTLVDVWRS